MKTFPYSSILIDSLHPLCHVFVILHILAIFCNTWHHLIMLTLFGLLSATFQFALVLHFPHVIRYGAYLLDFSSPPWVSCFTYSYIFLSRYCRMPPKITYRGKDKVGSTSSTTRTQALEGSIRRFLDDGARVKYMESVSHWAINPERPV